MKGSRCTLCAHSTDSGRAGVEVSKHPLVELPNACLYIHSLQISCSVWWSP